MNDRVPWTFLDQYRGSHFEGEWPTIPELFVITAERNPDRACFTIYDPDRRSLTYAQALLFVRRLAASLVRDGIAPGERVALSGKNSVEWAVAYLAIQFAGAIVVPIDYQLKPDEVANLIRVSGARILFMDVERYEELEINDFELIAKYSLSSERPRYALDPAIVGEESGMVEPLVRTESDIAVILFTSGTMGTPKGVMLTHANLVSDCFLAQANLPVFYDDVFYALLPLHHSYTMLAVFIESVSVGAELVFGQKLAVKQILSDLKSAKVTMFLGVPMLFNKVLAGIMRGVREKGPIVYVVVRALMVISGTIKRVFGVNPGKRLFRFLLDKASLSTNRICISGGGPLAPSVFRQFNQLGIDFVQGYGLTETSPILTLNPTHRYKVASVGKLLPRVEMKILNPDAEGRGEIAVKGPMVMKGYFDNPVATAEVSTWDGWFRTGDVGWLDEDNYLYLTGRAKNLIVTEGGKNVYPEEIEDHFQLYPEVEQILVHGYAQDKAMKVEGIEAMLYPNGDVFRNDPPQTVRARLEAIVEEVNANLLPYQRISRIVVLDEPLETTTTRKIKRAVALGKLSG